MYRQSLLASLTTGSHLSPLSTDYRGNSENSMRGELSFTLITGSPHAHAETQAINSFYANVKFQVPRGKHPHGDVPTSMAMKKVGVYPVCLWGKVFNNNDLVIDTYLSTKEIDTTLGSLPSKTLLIPCVLSDPLRTAFPVDGKNVYCVYCTVDKDTITFQLEKPSLISTLAELLKPFVNGNIYYKNYPASKDPTLEKLNHLVHFLLHDGLNDNKYSSHITTLFDENMSVDFIEQTRYPSELKIYLLLLLHGDIRDSSLPYLNNNQSAGEYETPSLSPIEKENTLKENTLKHHIEYLEKLSKHLTPRTLLYNKIYDLLQVYGALSKVNYL